MGVHTPWLPSVSAGGRTAACPGWSALAYVLRNDIVESDATFSQPGTDAHRMLELMREGKKPKTRRDREARKRLQLTDKDEQHFRSIKFAHKAIGKIIKRAKKRNPGTTVYYERWLHVFDGPRRSDPDIEAYTGTVDVSVVNRDMVQVIDYKHGAGVAVHAHDNMQVIGYLFAGLQQAIADKLVSVDDVPGMTFYGTIVQPRCNAVDPVQTVTYDWPQLVQKTERLRGAVELAAHLREAAQDDLLLPPLHFLKRGDHCQFCPVRLHCPRWAKPVEAVVSQYKADTDNNTAGYARLQQRDLEQLYLDAAGIENYLKKLRDYLAARLAQGKGAGLTKAIPGSNRTYLHPQAGSRLRRALNDGRIDKKAYALCFEERFTTLTELEHMLPADVFDTITTTKPNRPSLVSVTDERPSVHEAVADRFRKAPTADIPQPTRKKKKRN